MGTKRWAGVLLAGLSLVWTGCGETDTEPPPDDGAGIIKVSSTTEEIANGGKFTPMTADGIPPFSFASLPVDVTNLKSTEMVINSITLTPVGGSLAQEFAINRDSGTTLDPITVADEKVAANGKFSFGLFFVPIASGPRNAEVKITYDGDKSFTFTFEARGRDNATLSPVASSTMEKIFGKRASSSLVGAMAADADGNLYFNLNANEWSDGFSENVAVARLNKDGSLGWAMEWNESYEQLSPDPGQNAESGGGAESMALGADGHLYIVGQRSQASSNSVFQAFVLKIKKDDGALVWSKGLTRGTSAAPSMANQSLKAYAVDASLTDRVLVTGQVADNQGVLLFAVKKDDGSLLWAKEIEVYSGVTERGHTLAVDASGNAYVGGAGNGTGLMLKVTGVDGDAPALEWVNELGMGTGGNVNSIALDASGNPYVSLDFRGATTRFAAARLSPAGALTWAKQWDPNNSGDNNNTYVVRVSGDQVLVGGRIAFAPFDTQFGEGFVMSLTTDGAWKWGSFYYTGKGTEEICEHRVKGFALAGDELLVLQQGHSGPNNADHYAGYWYQANNDTLELPGGDGSERLADVSVNTSSKLSGAAIADLQNGTLHDIDAGSTWQAAPSDAVLEEATEREANNGRTHALLQRVKLTGN